MRRSLRSRAPAILALTVSLCSLSGVAHAANHTPTISGAPPSTFVGGNYYDFRPLAADADGNPIWFSIKNKPSWAAFNGANGRIQGTAVAGTYSNIVITVTDGMGSAYLAPFSITVTPNHAPAIAGSPTTAVTVNTWYKFQPTVRDADGDRYWFKASNVPSWATFNQATGQLAGMPTAAGVYSNIVISATDGKNSSSLPAFSITVGSPNHAPTITGSPATTVTANKPYAFTPAAADADKNTLGFSIANKPSWAAFNTATGALTGTPSTANVGSYAGIVISVSDGKATTSLSSFGITVASPPNTPPTIAGAPVNSVKAASTYAFQPSAADANGDPLAFSIANKPSWAVFNAATGRLAGTPTAAEVGTYNNIVISVSDGKASASLAPFSIAVTQSSNGSISLTWLPPTQKTDETALTNLAGYKIQYGTNSATLNQVVDVKTAGISSYVIENLTPATYYFAVTAYTTTGEESDPSNVVTKVVQ